ncbi:MAG TPA: DUF5941 domain-containing protein, partial [Actinopolymorphaceae bacterium]
PTIALAPEALPVAFAFVAVSAYHQYDTVYRLRGADATPARWLVVVTGGHDGRILALSVLAVLGPSAWTIGLLVLTIWLALAFLGESIAHTLAWVRASQADPDGAPWTPDDGPGGSAGGPDAGSAGQSSGRPSGSGAGRTSPEQPGQPGEQGVSTA